MSNTTSLLDGLLVDFEYVASDANPVITLDNQRRFYINTSARRLMSVVPYERLALAYNPTERAIAVVRTSVVSPQDKADVATSNYNVDKRYYMSARHFANKYGYAWQDAPYTFVYERGASDGSLFIFRLVETP